ncbi:DnaJ-like subfamily C member 3 [Mizuhopecten yessoensis]|uniref:DnaJ-like subfamily C member 3 n=1 Tax=Mizuhopecten yessoensis TaxID=6573 RepID=A0A210R0I6_MIZYE|nr:DnaJ-like subfamily C member 3 [Mizuhopecten yessoensis]
MSVNTSSKGQSLEAAGQLDDALAQYKRGLEENPSNHLSQFRCGMVCINLGDSKSALKFLSKAFELHPVFSEALVERGSLYLKLGDLLSARDDFNLVLQREPYNREVKLRVQEIDGLKQNIPFAKLLFKQKDYVGCREALEQILTFCPWDVIMREIRAECYLYEGKHGKAIADIQATLRHRRLKTPAYFKLSLIYRCYPDHKECYVHYKKTKTLLRLMQSAAQFKNDMRNAKCVSKAQQILQTESTVKYYVSKANSFLCHCHLLTDLMTALAACDFVLAINSDNIQVRIDRADIAMEIINEKLNQAVTDYLYIKSRTEANTHVIGGLKKAKQLLKISERKKTIIEFWA